MLPPYRYLTTVRSMTEGSVLAIDAIKLGELFQQDGQLATLILRPLVRAMLDRVGTLRSLV
jgi:hypothetical protein